MKSFRTELLLAPAAEPIRLNDRIVTVGSCFSDSIGSLFQKNKFECAVNPLRVLYSPAAICSALGLALKTLQPEESSFAENDGVWCNFNFHSGFSASAKTEVAANVSNALHHTRDALSKCSVLIITLGSSWVFGRKDTGDLVANCHKFPGDRFIKKLMAVDEIVAAFDSLLAAIRALPNPIRIILTVSPVRHIKDTLELNSVSKAILRLAAHQLQERHAGIEYFPAFEVMTDDLRDYRFYEADMLHPSPAAIDYIWEKFAGRYFDPTTRALIKEWTGLATALAHQPFQPSGKGYEDFLRKTLSKLEELKSYIDVEDEIRQLHSRLIPFEK